MLNATVTAQSRLQTPEQFANIILKTTTQLTDRDELQFLVIHAPARPWSVVTFEAELVRRGAAARGAILVPFRRRRPRVLKG